MFITISESSEKNFDFGTAKKPSVESEEKIEQTRRRLVSNDQDSVFGEDPSDGHGPVSSKEGQKSNRLMTSTPAKKLSRTEIPEPAVSSQFSTISSGKKSKTGNIRHQSSSAEKKHASEDLHGVDMENQTQNLSDSAGRNSSDVNKRENYGEELDFEEEIALGMDPLLACVLLTKVRLFLLQYNLINYFCLVCSMWRSWLVQV